MLQSERILHEKVRDKVQDLTKFWVNKFTLATIDETDMSYVLTQIPDRFFALKRDLKKDFHRESAYRKIKFHTSSGPMSHNDFEELKSGISSMNFEDVAEGAIDDKGVDFDIDKVSTTMPKLGKIDFTPKTVNKMKTVLVIYTDSEVFNPGYAKRYAFNTSSDLVEGDMVKSNQYDTNMQIVSVLDEAYKYFNKNDGQLSNVHNNAMLFPIRELRIVESTNAVTAVKL